MEGAANNDGLISQFLSVTGSSDATKASSYLEMGGNNLEMAVSLYMENEQGPGSFGDQPAMDSGGGGGAMLPPGMGMDEVRAPDATRTMRLMDDDAGGVGINMLQGLIPNDPSLQMMNAMMNEQLNMPTAFSGPHFPGTRASARDTLDAMVARAADGAMDMEDSDEDMEYRYDDEEKVQEVDENGNDKPAPPRLADMFSPPVHIMHQAGGFMGARTMAKDSKRWLLVNIQRDQEFASHALNRDVWRDELVENLIRSGFIFWQQVMRGLVHSLLLLSHVIISAIV